MLYDYCPHYRLLVVALSYTPIALPDRSLVMPRSPISTITVTLSYPLCLVHLSTRVPDFGLGDPMGTGPLSRARPLSS